MSPSCHPLPHSPLLANMFKLGVNAVEVAGKRVLIRVDFNVPMDKSCHVTSTQRIDAALETITNVVDRGAKSVVLL